MKILTLIMILTSIFFIGCNNHQETHEIKITNEFLLKHRNRLDIDFQKLILGHEGKTQLYLRKYNTFKEAAIQMQSHIQESESIDVTETNDEISKYISCIKNTTPNTEKKTDLINNINNLFNSSPNQSKDVLFNKFLISYIVVLNELSMDFNRLDYKFDFAKPEVQTTNNTVNLGETIEFDIFLQAYNTYMNRKIIIGKLDSNDQFVSVYDTISAFENGNWGKLKYKLTAKERGEHYFMGKIIYFDKSIPFRYKYYVK